MRLPTLILLIVSTLATGCGSVGNVRETSNQFSSRGENLTTLNASGWSISQPISVSTAESERSFTRLSADVDGKKWSDFTAQLVAGNELRRYTHNAGHGYAIFRSGILVDTFMWVIF